MSKLTLDRQILWAVLATPGAWIAGRYVADAIPYGEVIHETGDWAVRLLIATLAVTPLRLAFRGQGWVMWLARRRRDFGLACFGYALFHLVVYLLRKADPGLILSEAVGVDLLTGWIAFWLFVPLTVTSNDLSVRRLGRRWGLLHKLVYPAAGLTLAHWLLTAFDPHDAIVHSAMLAAVIVTRIGLSAWRRGQQRRQAASPT